MSTKTSNSHKIGLVTATIICMNAMIGAGIFATPAKLARSVGPAGILTYIFVIIAVLFMAISLARVAQAYPQEGSFYTYAKQWGGHIMGIIAAGSYILGVIIALGLLVQIAASYFHAAFPSISFNAFGIGIISIIAILNMLGVRIMQAGQIILLICTLSALLLTIGVGFLNINLDNLTPFMPHGFSSLLSATSAAIFAFFGFESAASLFTVVENPEKTIPRAFTLSIIAVGLLYLAFISSLILSVPNILFTSENIALSTVISQAFGYKWVANIIGFAILTAILGVIQSMTYSIATLSRSFLGLLKNKYLKEFAQEKYSFQVIILIISIITLINFFIVKNPGIFFNLTALGVVSAFALSIVTLVINKLNKTVWQKVSTFIGLLTAAIIFISAVHGLISSI